MSSVIVLLLFSPDVCPSTYSVAGGNHCPTAGYHPWSYGTHLSFRAMVADSYPLPVLDPRGCGWHAPSTTLMPESYHEKDEPLFPKNHQSIFAQVWLLIHLTDNSWNCCKLTDSVYSVSSRWGSDRVNKILLCGVAHWNRFFSILSIKLQDTICHLASVTVHCSYTTDIGY